MRLNSVKVLRILLLIFDRERRVVDEHNGRHSIGKVFDGDDDRRFAHGTRHVHADILKYSSFIPFRYDITPLHRSESPKTLRSSL